MEYTVTYKIDVNADTPKKAALEVEETLKNGHYRPNLTVVDKQGLTSFIDLEKEPVEEIEEYEERLDGNKHIKILQHDISYWYRDTDLDMDDSEQEHIAYVINQGYREGELNMTDPNNPDETFRGWWRITKE